LQAITLMEFKYFAITATKILLLLFIISNY